MKKVLLITLLILGLVSSKAQVVTTDPAIPTDNASVTIYFHADRGNQGLMGFTGTVYAHLGVITDKSTSPTDWKYVKTEWDENIAANTLTRENTNLYSLVLGPSIRDYFGVPTQDTIKQIAFVFRNSGGTQTGRSADGSDIFTDVFKAGINVSISSPQDNLIIQSGGKVDIIANSSNADSMIVYVDDNVIHRNNTATLDIDHTENSIGTHKIKVIAKNSTEQKADSVYFTVRGTANVSALPTGWQNGINYITADSVGLVLLAPNKDYVYVIGDFNDWTPVQKHFMNKTPDGEQFWIGIGDLVDNKEYIFQYFIDGEIRIADPFAEKLSDPNDVNIDNATYPNLIAYPTGKTSNIASVLQTNQTDYQWQVTNFVAPPKEDLVIYELLVRDFIGAHNYETLIDTIDYLDRLGMNAIELMPVNEFENNESWGYNTSFHFAPDKYYGTKNKLKEFIDTCHQRGIAVILDMVLNHTYGQSPLVRMYYNSNTYKPTPENPWFNVDSPNDVFSWGNDFDHESDYTKTYVDSVNAYWINEYKVDGFRFDFTKGFTNTPGDGGSYDAARIGILKRMADKIWEEKSNAYVILEHFTQNNEEKELADYGMMIWGNLNHNYSEAAMGFNDGGKSNFSWGSYKSRGWLNPNLVTYMESHDEERIMYKVTNFGNSGTNYNTRTSATGLRRLELNAAFFFTIPGPKMIWQFGELGYDISIDDPCRVCNKPIRWDMNFSQSRKRVYDVYKELIDLKKQFNVFRTTDFTLNVSDAMKSIHLFHADMNVVVLGNFGVEEGQIDPNFASTGDWYEYFSGDTLDVSDTNAELMLDPGEYRIYSTQKLGESRFTGIDDLPIVQTKVFDVYPNPADRNLFFNLSSIDEDLEELMILNSNGQVVEVVDMSSISKFSPYPLSLESYNSGLYFFKLISEHRIYTGKFLKR